MSAQLSLLGVFNNLFKAYGKQYWWPGETPFEIMIGAILTQNTSWVNVEKAIDNLTSHNILDAEKIVQSDESRLAKLLKPSGYFNLKAKRVKNYCQWYLAQGGYDRLSKQDSGPLRNKLLTVNGVGPETADDIMLYAFERPVFVVDAYTRRLFARLGLIDGSEPYEHIRQLFEQKLGEDVVLYNEYHALIVWHGKYFCKKNPKCNQCCINEKCQHAMNL